MLCFVAVKFSISRVSSIFMLGATIMQILHSAVYKSGRRSLADLESESRFVFRSPLFMAGKSENLLPTIPGYFFDFCHIPGTPPGLAPLSPRTLSFRLNSLEKIQSFSSLKCVQEIKLSDWPLLKIRYNYDKSAFFPLSSLSFPSIHEEESNVRSGVAELGMWWNNELFNVAALYWKKKLWNFLFLASRYERCFPTCFKCYNTKNNF